VDEDGDTDEASDVEGVGVGVGVDIRDSEELVTAVVAFNEMLVRLFVDCEGVDVERSDRILMTVTVDGERLPVLSPLLSSPMGTTMIFTVSAMN